LELEDLIY